MLFQSARHDMVGRRGSRPADRRHFLHPEGYLGSSSKKSIGFLANVKSTGLAMTCQCGGSGRARRSRVVVGNLGQNQPFSAAGVGGDRTRPAGMGLDDDPVSRRPAGRRPTPSNSRTVLPWNGHGGYRSDGKFHCTGDRAGQGAGMGKTGLSPACRPADVIGHDRFAGGDGTCGADKFPPPANRFDVERDHPGTAHTHPECSEAVDDVDARLRCRH